MAHLDDDSYQADEMGCACLAVFAHPDDAELACGGTLARWAEAGWRVVIVTIAEGDKGAGTGAIDPAALAAVRRSEADAAGRLLGVSERRSLGRADGEFDNDLALRGDIVAVVRDVRPAVVITSDPTSVFFGSHVEHRDHRQCGWAVIDAVAPAAAMPLYFADAGPPHQVDELWLASSKEADHFVPIAGYVDVKAAALAAHRSQVVGIDPRDHQGSELAGALRTPGGPPSAGSGGRSGPGVSDDTHDALRRLVAQRAEQQGSEAGFPAESFRRLVLGDGIPAALD